MQSTQSRWRTVVMTLTVAGLAFVTGWGWQTPVSEATPGPQQPKEVLFMEVHVGELSDAAPQQNYSIYLSHDMVFSVSVFTRIGNAIPLVTVYDPNDAVLAEGVKPAPDADSSIINAVQASETGRYVLTVRQETAGTSGDYVLIVQPGYEFLNTWDDFESYDERLSLCWQPFSGIDAMAAINDGMMVVNVLNANTTSFVAPCEPPVFSDFFIEAKVEVQTGPDYYEYGFALRKSLDGISFYAVVFTSESLWSVQYYDGDSWSKVKDWTHSDVIDSALTSPKIGVLVQGGTFTLYFNDQFVGSVSDLFPRATAGTVALLASSGDGQMPWVQAHFDNIVITRPRTAND